MQRKKMEEIVKNIFFPEIIKSLFTEFVDSLSWWDKINITVLIPTKGIVICIPSLNHVHEIAGFGRLFWICNLKRE